jgi:hypothetical protein
MFGLQHPFFLPPAAAAFLPPDFFYPLLPLTFFLPSLFGNPLTQFATGKKAVHDL